MTTVLMANNMTDVMYKPKTPGISYIVSLLNHSDQMTVGAHSDKDIC